MSDPIILIIVDITFQILFNNLIESFYLSIGLKMKDYRKLVVYSEFCNEYCKEPRGKGCISIYYKLV